MDKKCKHKISGKEGIIKSELSENKNFPAQWGIFWTFTYDKNTPSHHYWNDKSLIEII
jgi:hypothetical protein